MNENCVFSHFTRIGPGRLPVSEKRIPIRLISSLVYVCMYHILFILLLHLFCSFALVNIFSFKVRVWRCSSQPKLGIITEKCLYCSLQVNEYIDGCCCPRDRALLCCGRTLSWEHENITAIAANTQSNGISIFIHSFSGIHLKTIFRSASINMTHTSTNTH